MIGDTLSRTTGVLFLAEVSYFRAVTVGEVVVPETYDERFSGVYTGEEGTGGSESGSTVVERGLAPVSTVAEREGSRDVGPWSHRESTVKGRLWGGTKGYGSPVPGRGGDSRPKREVGSEEDVGEGVGERGDSVDHGVG